MSKMKDAASGTDSMKNEEVFVNPEELDPAFRIVDSTMNQETMVVVLSTVVSVHKTTRNFTKMARLIKIDLDKKLGPLWQVVVGTNFGSFVTAEAEHCIFFYLDDDIAVYAFKTIVSKK